MNGTVTVPDKGAVCIHSYMSPGDAFHTTTQLIETSPRVIAIDAQLLPPTPTRPSPMPRASASPSTAAFDGDDLLIVDFQFRIADPKLPFNVVRVHV